MQPAQHVVSAMKECGRPSREGGGTLVIQSTSAVWFNLLTTAEVVTTVFPAISAIGNPYSLKSLSAI